MQSFLQPELVAASSVLDCFLGLAVGLALGLTGGGGMLAVPALVVGLDYSLQEAVPVALVAICIGASVGALDGFRRRLVRYRAACVMAAAGVACAPLGMWLAKSVPVDVLTYGFACLLILCSLNLMSQSSAAKSAAAASKNNPKRMCRIDPETGRFSWNSRSFFTFSGIGSVSGTCSGMLGVGGGFVIVPSLRKSSDLSMKATVATSLATVALVSGATVSLFLLHGGGIPGEGGLFILATAVGILIARSWFAWLPDSYVHAGFASFATVTAVGMIYQQVIQVGAN